MGMGIFFGGAAVGSPAGMAYAVGTLERVLADDLFEISQLARRASQLKLGASSAYGDAGGVITPVLQPAKAFKNERDDLLIADVADDAAHLLIIEGGRRRDCCTRQMQFAKNQNRRRSVSIFKVKGKLFDHRIGQHFSRNALHFRLGSRGVERIAEFEHKIFALAYVFDSLVLHLPESTVDGLPLRVEDCLLERHVDMSLHRARL